jgi:hypothetical protein
LTDATAKPVRQWIPDTAEGWLTFALRAVFAAVVILRFCYPFHFNPKGWRIWSDMQRHWENGASLTGPSYIAGFDPKAFQAWVWLLRQLSDNGHDLTAVAIMTGLFCAALPLFWFLGLREIASERLALGLSILIGIHPSMLAIYGFFMNETAVLTLPALAMWPTLRCLRTGGWVSYACAAAAWGLAALAKQMVLPFMVLCLGYLFLRQERKARAAALTVILLAALWIPAGLHSLKSAHVFAPFGYGVREKINHDSGHIYYHINFFEPTGGKWIYEWHSSAYDRNPLTPLGEYHTYRPRGPYESEPVSTAGGDEAWEPALRAAAARHTWREAMLDIRDNVVYFLFGECWPDVSEERMMAIPALHGRWTWAPLTLLILCAAPFVRLRPERMAVVLTTWAGVLFMFLQTTGVMEGRYRKAFEPFIIVSAAFVLCALRASKPDGTVRAHAFIADAWRRAGAMLKISSFSSR